MKLRCLIVDDEPLALDLLENYVLRIESLQLVSRCESAVAALNLLQKEKIDLIFLDIEMPVLTGIDFLKTLKHTPKIIITTANRNYAAESYDFEVTDYLLKPISFARFLKAVNRVLEKKTELHPVIPRDGSAEEEPFIIFKVDKQIVKVNVQDILYIESLKDYIMVHTLHERFSTFQTLSGILEKLPSKKFIRIHKSFVIAIDKATRIEGNMLKLRDKLLPIGRNYKDDVMNRIYSSGVVGSK